MKRLLKKILTIVTAVCLVCAPCAGITPASESGFLFTPASGFVPVSESGYNAAPIAEYGDYGLCDNIQDGTILHCFDWKYNDIKAELPNIAKAGFTSIQTSPAQKGMNSGTWYWLYQPLGFSIQTNDLGTKEELRSLCDEAHKYGIHVIVDVVSNHLSSDHSNIQSDLKDAQYWHNFGSNINYQIREQVITGDIGMKDLASENAYVQQCVRGYVEELKSVGVDGIRWDAGKHIGLPSEGCNFWPAVTQGTGLYNYAEILVGPDDRKTGNEALMQEYTDYVSVTDSKYSYKVRHAFETGNLSLIDSTSESVDWADRGVSTGKLVYWAESHDNYSNNGEYGESSQYTSQNVVDRAYAVVASRAGASALYFSRPSSNVKDQIIAGQKGSTHFTSSEVAAVNHFHNAMAGQSDTYTTSGDCSVVCREQGAVIVKGSGSGYVSVTNGQGKTAPGTYTDEISGGEFTVTSSTISGTIGSTGIAVLFKEGEQPTQGGSDPVETPADPGNGSLEPGAGDVTIPDLEGTYTWDQEYIYQKQVAVNGANSSHRYLVLTYTGDISTLRFESLLNGGFTWFAQNAQGSFKTVDGGLVPAQGNNTTVIIDLAQSGCGVENFISGFHIHSGDPSNMNGSVTISRAWLTSKLPETQTETETQKPEEETTTVPAPVETTTPAPQSADPIEVFGLTVQSNEPGIIKVEWGQNDEQILSGQTYNVYLDGGIAADRDGKTLENVPCAAVEIPASAGSHNVRVSAVLNGKETAGISQDVTVEGKSEETESPTEPATPKPEETESPTEAVTPNPQETESPTEPATPKPEETESPTEAVTPNPQETESPSQPSTPGSGVTVTVNGYQISAVAEGFRTVYTVDDPDDEVEEAGMIYAIAEKASPDELVAGANTENVKSFKATDAGLLDVSTSDSISADTYCMTMGFLKPATAAYVNAGWYVRAYAKLKDGGYIYSGVNSFSLYQIADYLYQNLKMNNQYAHDYLYNNLLGIADPSYPRKDFAWNNSIVEPSDAE